MKLMKVALVIALVLSVASCDTLKTKPSSVQNFDAPKLDPSLLVKCDPLDVPNLGLFSLGDLTTAYTDLQGQYTECAVRQACLVGASLDPKKATLRCAALDKLPQKTKGIPPNAVPTKKDPATIK
jgi:hypothetical protein